MKLSLAAIVKNESENIFKMLDSASMICSQLIIVDTGSTDKTPTICTNYGAEVYFSEWRGDFSYSRNESLKYVLNPWILVLDADETIDVESIRKNLKLFEDENTGGINVIIKNNLNSDDTVSEHRYTRIFRSHPQIRYSGRVHEQIRRSIEALDMEIAESDIVINHFGYSQNTEQRLVRNAEMLSNELAENPNDGWLKYHLAETHFSAGKLHEAGELYADIIDSEQLNENQKDITMIRLAQIALSEGHFYKIDKYLCFNSADTDIEGLRKYVLASSFMSRNRFKDALELYESIEIRTSGRVDQSFVEKALEVLKKLEL